MSKSVNSSGFARNSIVVVVCMLAVVSGLASGFLIEASHPHPATSHTEAGSLTASGALSGRGPGVLPSPTHLPPAASQLSATGANVSRTLVLYNDTFVSGNFIPANGNLPTGVAYDSSNGLVYVVDYLDANVTVFNSTTDEVVATIPTGSPSGGIVYDNGTNQVVVADTAPPGLSFIDPTTNSIVSTLSIPQGAYSLAYDSGKHELFVTGDSTDNVTVVDDATDAVVTTVPVGEEPEAIVYDAALGEVFVADSKYFTDNVSVISDATNTVVATVTLGGTPEALVYDPLDQDVYAINGDNLSKISPATNEEVGNISLPGGPEGLSYDSTLDEIFTMGSQGNVTVIGATTGLILTNISLPADVSGLGEFAYDAATEETFVTGEYATVAVISDLTDAVVANVTVGASPWWLAYDSAKGEFYIASGEGSTQVEVVRAVTGGIVTNISVGDGPTDLLYDSGRGEIFVSNYWSGNVSVINDTSNTVVATISTTMSQLAYDAANDEVFGVGYMGLGVTVVNDTSNTIVTTLDPNKGTSGIAYDSDNGQLYIASGANENVTVVNATTLSTVTSIPLPGYSYLAAYDNTTNEIFVETETAGLASLSVISGATDTLLTSTPLSFLGDDVAYDPLQGALYLTNGEFAGEVEICSVSAGAVATTTSVGEFPIGVAYDSLTGDVWVADFGSAALSVLNPGASFPVTFSQTGLPSGTSWSVALDNATLSSTGGSIVFNELNGTYGFTVPSVTGFLDSTTSGSITVAGASVARTISFTPEPTSQKTPETFPVTFTETGLTSGAGWSVTLNGTNLPSDTGSIVFAAPNGTVTFTVGAVAGFSVAPASGSITIAGKPVGESVTFTASSSSSSGKNGSGSSSSSTLLGLPTAEGYLLIALLVVVVVIAAVVGLRMRKGKAPPAEPADPIPGDPPPQGPA
jgi:YVTN family beta-propeller protein